MKKDELFLTTVLVAVLAAGILFESIRGGPKNAEVIITPGNTTPFDAKQNEKSNSTASPALAANSSESVKNASGTNPNGNRTEALILSYLNNANAQVLEQIPGIGKVTAQTILLYRANQGWFTSTNDLLNINGIGPKKQENIIQYLQRTVSKRTNTQTGNPIQFQPRVINPFNQLNVPNRINAPYQYKAPTRILARKPIPLNRATKEQLMAVAGIGPQLAQAILERRAKRKKGFRTWREVGGISGIGKNRLNLLKEHFTLD